MTRAHWRAEVPCTPALPVARAYPSREAAALFVSEQDRPDLRLGERHRISVLALSPGRAKITVPPARSGAASTMSRPAISGRPREGADGVGAAAGAFEGQDWLMTG